MRKGTARTETWLWLAHGLGFAAPHSSEILAMYPNPEELVAERFTTDLSAILTPQQLEVLRNKEPEDFLPRLRRCEALDIGIVCYEDDAYPPLLRHIPSAPPVLFYKGDIGLLQNNLTFAMVGTRRPSAYGVEATRTIAQGLAQAGVILVSGMATGLDSESHKACLQAGTPTVACIAFGHTHCYPAANQSLKDMIERHGVVVSEYPPDTGPQKAFFLQRNRLIAALSKGLCVAEARRISGTMNTVSAALEFGRDVFSVPGNIFSALCEGTNHLLAEGAMPALSAESILTWYGCTCADKPQQPEAQQPAAPLSATARIISKVLSHRPQTLAALCDLTALSTPAVMAALTELELAGISRQQAGRQFVLAR